VKLKSNFKSDWAITRELTVAQMKARYRGTLAGFVWVVLCPILIYLVQALVFRSILRIQIPHYSLFLLGGLLPWSFIVTSLQMGIPVFQDSRQLLLAFKIRPFILLASSILDNWVNFLAAFISSIAASGLFLLPFAVISLLAGVAGILALLAVLNVFYRDVRFLSQFLVNLMFFLTPIFYPVSFIPSGYRWLVQINPFFLLIEPVRICVYQFSLGAALDSLAKSIGFGMAAMTLAGFFWKRRKNDFYHAI